MTGSIALLFATLIGVFITPDGIVVGTDTAISDLSGQVASQQKYCVTGPRSVATMQGTYLLRDSVTKTTTELYDRFRVLCAEMDATPSPEPLRDQAARLANTLKGDLVAFLERVPAEEVVRTYSPSRVIARIAV